MVSVFSASCRDHPSICFHLFRSVSTNGPWSCWPPLSSVWEKPASRGSTSSRSSSWPSSLVARTARGSYFPCSVWQTSLPSPGIIGTHNGRISGSSSRGWRWAFSSDSMSGKIWMKSCSAGSWRGSSSLRS